MCRQQQKRRGIIRRRRALNAMPRDFDVDLELIEKCLAKPNIIEDCIEIEQKQI